MRAVALLLAGAAILVASAVPALAAHPDVTIKMHAMNGSGESGQATITDLGNGKTRVVLDIENENTTGDQPAHIHMGTCAHLNPAPKYALKNVVLGHSNTTLDIPMSKLLTGTMAINVHESAKNIGRYVSCGNIP